MSRTAMAYVAGRDGLASSQKFVLVALADVADATGLCFPSIEHICRFTCLNRKTVISALQGLAEAGHICDTGERRGRTRQVKVWQIAGMESIPESGLFPEQTGGEVHAAGNSSENGTVPLTGRLEAESDPDAEPLAGERVPKKSPDSGTRNQEQNNLTQSAGAEEGGTKRNGSETGMLPPVIEAAKRLRAMGMLDVHGSRPELIDVLEIPGVTIQMLTDTAGELAQRDGTPPKLRFLVATVTGRMRDRHQQRGGSARAGPAPAGHMRSQFAETTYQGTHDDQLPDELR